MGDKTTSLCNKDIHTMDVLTNQRELHIESKSVSASCMRF